MNIRKWLKLALLFSLVFVVSAALPYTLTYVFSHSGTLVNTFLPPGGLQKQAAVQILVEKTVRNTGEALLGPDGFTFILTDDATGEQKTTVSDRDGAARFELFFKGSDAGKTFSYTLSEHDDGRENIIYSKRKYALQISVDMEGEKPVATVLMDGVAAETPTARFENICSLDELPMTGDGASVALYAAAALASLLMLALLRRPRRA